MTIVIGASRKAGALPVQSRKWNPSDPISLASRDLCAAAQRGDIGAVRAALARGAWVDWRLLVSAEEWSSGLENAAWEGHLTLVQYLVDRGATPGFHVEALRAACHDTRLECFEYLLDKGFGDFPAACVTRETARWRYEVFSVGLHARKHCPPAFDLLHACLCARGVMVRHRWLYELQAAVDQDAKQAAAA